MLHAEFGDDDWAMEECSTEDMEPEAMYSAPFDPNTLYVPYDAAALQECLSAWESDEPQRKAAAALVPHSRTLEGRRSGPSVVRSFSTICTQ